MDNEWRQNFMSEVLIQVTKNNKVYNVAIEDAIQPNGDFTILLPGKYSIVNKRQEENYFNYSLSQKELEKLFHSFESNPSFGFNVAALPKELVTYDTIMAFLPSILGYEYVQTLGKEWVSNLMHIYNPKMLILTEKDTYDTIKACNMAYNDCINGLYNVVKHLRNKYAVLMIDYFLNI